MEGGEVFNREWMATRSSYVLSALLEHAEQIIFALDPEARVCLFSRACEAFTGHRAQSLMGRSPSPVLLSRQDEDLLRNRLGRHDGNGAPLRLESRWKCADGSVQDVSLLWHGVNDDCGNLLCHLAIGPDSIDAARFRPGRHFPADSAPGAGRTPDEVVGAAILVNDDAEMTRSLETMLSSAGIATCSHEGGDALLEAGLPDGPACVLLDLRPPGKDGIRVQRALRAIDPGLPVIFLGADADLPSVVAALKGGALDFLEKEHFRPEELVNRVASALDKHRRYLDRKEHQEALRARVLELTPREREVALLVARGKSNKMTASELGISERTVEIHRGNAMQKLRLRSVADLTRFFTEFDAMELRAARQPARGGRLNG